jgi:hypothetical protein
MSATVGDDREEQGEEGNEIARDEGDSMLGEE